MTKRQLLGAVAAIYLALLALSHIVDRHPDPLLLLPEEKAAQLDGAVTLAYREHAAPGSFATPLLLLHGSPGSSRDFSTLAPALATRFRTLAPDLPGFGHSTRRVPDYSIRSHAHYALSFLDRLDIDSAHVLGFSMGGGVALEMARQAPDRVRSVTLLSSIGVQELELLGDYRLNHAIHWLQLSAISLLQNAVPHFGLLDDFPLSIPYARNFYDTDQRPLRATLQSLAPPTLILHGTRDVLVPVAAAREHHRLVPQSEMVLLETDHFVVFGGGELLADPIADFLNRVERGEAATRESAPQERLAASNRPFSARDLPPAHGIALFILMVLLAIATFVSEDLASIGTGLLVAQGRIGFFAGAIACIAGIVVGDIAIYFGGRLLGRPWLERAPLRWILSPNAVERSRLWFNDKGPSVIFASRFFPGTRVATYFAAGILGTGFWRFALFLGAAVVLWVPLVVGAAAVLGARVFEIFDVFARFALPGVLALAIVGWLLFRSLKTLLSRNGRRLLTGRWRRIRHWEFWPPWLFYPPVLLHVARLGLRYRSLTLFTAANPAMPASGFIGESKAAILAGLDKQYVADHALIRGNQPLEEMSAAVDRFILDHGLHFPVVLKPDVGERGTGVVVARNPEEVERYLREAQDDLLIQEYVPGVELGVFYLRLPGKDRGRIFSVTEKRLPTVTGDGSKTLEDLILADERAVAMASVYFDRLAPELDRVPVRGETVGLVEVGTHCRGAIFLDGTRFRTPELEAAVEEISRSYAGFYFGRYDLKAPSYEAFARGEGIRVIELNGVTSEATHIYDPSHSLIDAYRTLFRQWDLAFEIGRRNAAEGAPVTSAGELVRMVAKQWWG